MNPILHFGAIVPVRIDKNTQRQMDIHPAFREHLVDYFSKVHLSEEGQQNKTVVDWEDHDIIHGTTTHGFFLVSNDEKGEHFTRMGKREYRDDHLVPDGPIEYKYYVQPHLMKWLNTNATTPTQELSNDDLRTIYLSMPSGK